ncbi:Kunitz family trypsin and protease inhibitor protein [Raphanus sativus]|nr:Kunitz family trypsin and protease inhibitor protein [Raphanus sativus]
MKAVGAITIFQLVLCFLFVAITTFSVVSGENEVVTDNFGRPVKANDPYLINVLSTPPLRQWITQLPPYPDCSDYVLMMTSTLNHFQRIAVRFILPSSSDDDVVRVSTELKIQFTGLYPCKKKQSGYWSVSSEPIERVVLTGSKSSNDSTFIIKPIKDRFYSLNFGSVDNSREVLIKFTDYREKMGTLEFSNGTGFFASFYREGDIRWGEF